MIKDFENIKNREKGLQRRLSARQMTMIAIGGAIGTGLFLGSKFAIGFAGPSVIISYAIGALITLLLMGCLAEMTVAHATSGSFGAYAEHYIGPLAGFLVRYCYWACIVLAVGTEITAVYKYMEFWFADIPGWAWIIGFSALLVGVNAMSVKTFGSVEYILSSIKVFDIVAFIIMGAYVVWGQGSTEYGIKNFTAYGGFFPNGAWGMWVAVVISIFSYLSVEMIAIAAGEAENPEQAVKSAFRATIVRLVVFYIMSLSLIIAIVPWSGIGEGESPFVTVMQVLNIPYAAGVLNFVVLIAALSAMNSQLYISTRMMFSLSRAGDSPTSLGKLNKHGTPLNALLLSYSGVALATILFIFFKDEAFTLMIAVSMFGAMFTWAMIFLTHLFFRRKYSKAKLDKLAFKMWFFPFGTLLGLCLMLSVMLTTAFTEVFRMTLIFGVPFMLFLVLLFYFVRKPRYQAEMTNAATQRS